MIIFFFKTCYDDFAKTQQIPNHPKPTDTTDNVNTKNTASSSYTTIITTTTLTSSVTNNNNNQQTKALASSASNNLNTVNAYANKYPQIIDSSINSLNNFNSIKSKKFQQHTRKLIQIALEMLLKSQVPQIQYIALTTINRIYDIYVYHNLFYPGHYETCYIPLQKRLMNKQQQRLQQTSVKLNQQQENNNASTNQSKDVSFSSSEKSSSTASSNSNDNKKNNKNLELQQYCKCIRPVRKTFEFRRKERASTIKEDPVSTEDLDTSCSSKPNPTPPQPLQARNLRRLTTRLSGFLRKFSQSTITTKATTNIQSSENLSSKSSDTNNEPNICPLCMKVMLARATATTTTSQKPSRFASLLNNNRINTSSSINMCEDEQTTTASSSSMIKIEKKDFTSSILIGGGYEFLAQSKPQSNDEAAAATLSLNENDNKRKQDENNNREIFGSLMNNNYQNQPFKCLANSIEPKNLLGIIHERLECHKKVDINASTMNTNTSSTNINNNNSTIGGGGAAAVVSGQTSGNSKVKCVPSARSINCQHHCVAILATRLFAILCNEQNFQQKIMSENQEACFNLIVDVLYPNNDPVSACK